MPLRRSARSRRSTPAFTPSTLEPLFDALETIGADNAQGEYYLPDLIAIYRRRSAGSSRRSRFADAVEIRGINSRSELAEVSTMVRQQKNEELMAAGVTLIDPATTYIDTDVEVGADTVIHPCVFHRARHDESARPARFTRAAGSSTRRSAIASSFATIR